MRRLASPVARAMAVVNLCFAAAGLYSIIGGIFRHHAAGGFSIDPPHFAYFFVARVIINLIILVALFVGSIYLLRLDPPGFTISINAFVGELVAFLGYWMFTEVYGDFGGSRVLTDYVKERHWITDAVMIQFKTLAVYPLTAPIILYIAFSTLHPTKVPRMLKTPVGAKTKAAQSQADAGDRTPEEKSQKS